MVDKEKTFWAFVDDLRTLGSDVKAHVLYGGCRWGEPSLIPDVVERLGKLDWHEVASSLMYMKSIGMTREDFKSAVKDIFNYHLECGQDLACSGIDKVALYAGWLNRLILICAEYGLGDVISLSKRDEPQQYPKDLLDFFNGDASLIAKLQDKDRGSVAVMVNQWSREGKCKNLNESGNKKLIAALLIKNGIVEPRQENVLKDIDSFRKKF